LEVAYSLQAQFSALATVGREVVPLARYPDLVLGME
jgi:hypothetical protein